MTNMKWIRMALLSGVAVGVASGSAYAGEVEDLAKKVEALEAEIIAMKALDASKALEVPKANGSVFSSVVPREVSIVRGTDSLSDWAKDRNPAENIPDDRGFSILVNPTADAAGGETVVTVSGYAKFDAIYDFDNPLGNAFNATNIGGSNSREETRLHAQQSRFRIKASTDTGLGQVRSLIEGDFWGGDFRLRHAWGELDIGDNVTFGAGRYWRNTYLFSGFVSTVDFNGPAGAGSVSRGAQVRLSYRAGPTSVHFAVENPTGGGNLRQLTDSEEVAARVVATSSHGTETDVDFTAAVSGACSGGAQLIGGAACISAADNTKFTADNGTLRYVAGAAEGATQSSGGASGAHNKVPDLSMRVNFDIPGGHYINAAGALRFFNTDTAHGADFNKSKVGWVGSVGGGFNLGTLASLTANFTYGNGVGNYLYYNGPAGVIQPDGEIRLIEGIGVMAGATFKATPTTSLNIGWGWTNPNDSDLRSAYGLAADAVNPTTSMMTIHGNIIWKPVSAMQLGWELIWGQHKRLGGTTDSALRGQFGAWFFF